MCAILVSTIHCIWSVVFVNTSDCAVVGNHPIHPEGMQMQLTPGICKYCLLSASNADLVVHPNPWYPTHGTPHWSPTHGTSQLLSRSKSPQYYYKSLSSYIYLLFT